MSLRSNVAPMRYLPIQINRATIRLLRSWSGFFRPRASQAPSMPIVVSSQVTFFEHEIRNIEDHDAEEIFRERLAEVMASLCGQREKRQKVQQAQKR